MSSAPAPTPPPETSAWLHAWYDPVAGLKAHSQCLRFADLAADGDYRLLVADADRKMKVYKGTGVSSIHALLDVPVAVATYQSDLATPRTPSVAVAAGPFVFIYRNLRPYMKFTLPPLAVVPEEVEAWAQLTAGRIEVAEAVRRLTDLRDSGLPVSSRAQDLLALADEHERSAYLAGVRDKPLVQQTVVTCMDTLQRDKEGDTEMSSLVIGTEAQQLHILDAAGAAIELTVALPSVPTHLAVSGLLHVDYRVNIACRDGVVYAVKGGQLMATKIECGALTAGLVRTETELFVGTMDARLHSYTVKGKRNWVTPLPATITAMCPVLLRRTKVADCCAVALEGGEVRIFNGKACVSTLTAPDTVIGMRFGQYGRESATLALASRSGALTFKMVKRSASFDAPEMPAGPPPEQDVPLAVPKKTRLYVEQTQREREQAVEMHRIFQRDLCKLRLTTARAYVKTITTGGSALASLSGANVRLSASVLGLGPAFKIKIDLTNVGSTSLSDIQVVFSFDKAMYAMPRAVDVFPLLLPSVRYLLEFPIQCVDEAGGADVVRCLVCRGKSAVPVITANITMPMSEPMPA